MQSHTLSLATGVLRRETHSGGTGATTYTSFTGRAEKDVVFTVVRDTNTGDRTMPHANAFNKYVHNKMTVDYWQTQLTSGPFGTTYTHDWGQQGNPATNGQSIYADFRSETYQKALSELDEKIRGELDLLIDLLEYESTTKMVTPAIKICHGFVDVVNRVVALKRHGLDKKNLDAIASAWLQYTYGVKPLVNSMFSFMEKLRDERRGSLVIKARGYTSTKTTVSSSPGYAQMISDIADVDRCHLEVELDLKPDVYSNLAGISSLNPVSLAWELFPYSFVIDWVYDIGSYLRGIETAMMYERFFRSGFKTLTSKRNIQSRYTGIPQVVAGSRYSQTGFGNSLGLKKDRSVLTGFPLPHLPVLTCDLGWRRIASATALAYGAIRRTGVDVRRAT